MTLPQPIIQFVSQDEAKLVQPWEILTRAGLLRVMPGITTDGASVPGAIDGLPGYHHFEGDTFPAAFAHDMLYAGHLCDRKLADEVLRDLMVANGVPEARADAFYGAVRLFGNRAWTEHTPDRVDVARKFLALIPNQ